MRVLGIFAHREDHVVAGWPIMQDKAHERFLYRLTNDLDVAVTESCSVAKISYCGNADLKNGFSLKPQRFELTKYCEKITKEISVVINLIKPDALFTHNPWGEYGHHDHRFLFSLVYNQFAEIPIIFTNIRAVSSYYNYLKTIPREYRQIFRGSQSRVPDLNFYNRQADIFLKHSAWTENTNLNPPHYPKPCGVVTLEKEAA